VDAHCSSARDCRVGEELIDGVSERKDAALRGKPTAELLDCGLPTASGSAPGGDSEGRSG